MERSALVIDFLETVIKKGYMQGIDSTKDAYLLNVTHGPQAALISHSTPLRDIGGSCLEWPLIIGQVDMCKYWIDVNDFLDVHLYFIVETNLQNYMVTPSEKHDKDTVKYLLKEVNSYSEFLCLTSAKKEELRTTS